MEHSLSEIRSPWRTATLVASAIATVELVALVVLGVVLLAEPVSRQVTKAAEQQAFAPVVEKPRPAAKPSRTKPAVPVLTRGETSVLVLNGNGRAGAAASAAERVRGLGYTIGGVGNAPRGERTRSVVMYRGGREAEARRLARDLRIRLVGPLDGLKPADLMGAHVALVIGS